MEIDSGAAGCIGTAVVYGTLAIAVFLIGYLCADEKEGRDELE